MSRHHIAYLAVAMLVAPFAISPGVAQPASELTASAPEAPTLAQFEAALAAQPSATAALQGWCAARHLASPANIAATPLAGADAPPPEDLRPLLAVAPTEPLAYRHVALSCGGKVLSVAHNWYVPARLTPAMNAALATTNTPFGKVVAPLGFTRQPLAQAPATTPTPATTNSPGPGNTCPPGSILAHRALLRRADGTPFSIVVECYTSANLARP